MAERFKQPDPVVSTVNCLFFCNTEQEAYAELVDHWKWIIDQTRQALAKYERKLAEAESAIVIQSGAIDDDHQSLP